MKNFKPIPLMFVLILTVILTNNFDTIKSDIIYDKGITKHIDTEADDKSKKSPFTSVKVALNSNIYVTLDNERKTWSLLLSINNVGTDALLSFAKTRYGQKMCDFQIECYKYHLIRHLPKVYFGLENENLPDKVPIELQSAIQNGMDVENTHEKYLINKKFLQDNVQLSKPKVYKFTNLSKQSPPLPNSPIQIHFPPQNINNNVHPQPAINGIPALPIQNFFSGFADKIKNAFGMVSQIGSNNNQFNPAPFNPSPFNPSPFNNNQFSNNQNIPGRVAFLRNGNVRFPMNFNNIAESMPMPVPPFQNNGMNGMDLNGQILRTEISNLQTKIQNTENEKHIIENKFARKIETLEKKLNNEEKEIQTMFKKEIISAIFGGALVVICLIAYIWLKFVSKKKNN